MIILIFRKFEKYLEFMRQINFFLQLFKIIIHYNHENLKIQPIVYY